MYISLNIPGKIVVNVDRLHTFHRWINEKHGYLFSSIFHEEKKNENALHDVVQHKLNDIVVKIVGYSSSGDHRVLRKYSKNVAFNMTLIIRLIILLGI